MPRLLILPVSLMNPYARWEPAINLAQCERLVESFWDDVGRDNEDYPEGSVCVPSNKWIGECRHRCCRVFSAFVLTAESNGEKTILAKPSTWRKRKVFKEGRRTSCTGR